MPIPFELVVNGSPLITGNVFGLVLILFIITVIIVTLGIIIWRKIRENEVLKYEFITIIAHKFRTPLTHLKWITEELAKTTSDAHVRENLTDMNQSTDHLIGLTGTLIELTNTDSEAHAAYKLERISLCKLAKNIAEAYKKAFHEKNIFFSIQTETPDVMVKADPTRVEFVLQTLLENSYTYTPPGRKTEVIVAREGHKAVVSVSDNGIGIAPNDLRRIFDKFYRAKNAQEVDTEGFGIGLFMAQSIMKRLGGKIEVYSPGRDQGSTFRMVLPLS